MLPITPSPFLRQALVADATTSAACGLLMLFGAGPLTGTLGLPESLLRAAGLVLLPYALSVGMLGMRPHLSRAVVWAVVFANGIWSADSALLLMSGWVAPTRAGYAFVIAQAVVTLMYAELQFIGLRRSTHAAA